MFVSWRTPTFPVIRLYRVAHVVGRSVSSFVILGRSQDGHRFHVSAENCEKIASFLGCPGERFTSCATSVASRTNSTTRRVVGLHLRFFHTLSASNSLVPGPVLQPLPRSPNTRQFSEFPSKGVFPSVGRAACALLTALASDARTMTTVGGFSPPARALSVSNPATL